ncbi:hypothetical protein [Novacetimonas pomaceti]|uniref:hypothetical protein n=1 Tax=Novacetimonas pomaceti TaxID=2021998 RepID=UPI001C2D66C9|nr:hypothetical protein [Novacetimonas pomaceti]MBV1833112.1 hypothetical protein [Novacetimonas pomaceti]
MRSRLILAFSVFGLFMMPFSSAGAQDLSRCITGSVVLPLLGGAGDGPIIPVRVNDHDVGMYISPDYDKIYVRETRDIRFPDKEMPATLDLNGYHYEEVDYIGIKDLQIGGADLGAVNGILIRGGSVQSAGGRPVIGVIGQMVLSRMLVLLDMPHGEVMYITTSDNAGCDDVGQQILGDKARSVRLDGDFQIPAVIDGKKRWFSMNPDLDVTSVPTSWDDLPEVAHPTLVRAEKTITRFDRFLTAGREVKIKDFEIGGERIKDDTVVLQRDIMTGHIGMPFFADRVVLFDYPHGRFYFKSTTAGPRPAGHHLHFTQTFTTHVSVVDRGDKAVNVVTADKKGKSG